MSKKGENIYKRKDGRWEGRYIKERIDGKIRYGSVYARSYREVKDKLEKEKKTFSSQKISAVKAGKVVDVGNQWFSEVALTLKESSKNKYEDILYRYILPELGEFELSEITNQQILGFVNHLLANGGIKRQGLASATVIEIVSVLNGIRVYAMRRDYIVPFSLECINLKREQADIRVLSLAEEQRLIDYLQKHMDLSALGILLCLFTGIRVGELCAMMWDDIDINEKKMYVRKTMQRLRAAKSDSNRTKVKILEPKSARSIRIIPLPGPIIGLLEEFYRPQTFLLTGEHNRYVEPRTMQNRFKKILSACDLPDVNFHALRHTFATRCIELGFDVKSLSEILGHADVTITMNRYVHPSMALKEENMERISKLFAVK